jgi:hypothetical protein
MKKVLFVLFAVLMLTFAAVSAQETAEKEVTLNFSTVGDLISWSTSAEEIYNMLNEYENVVVELEQDEKYGKTISATAETEDEVFSYVFYFDNETEKLWEVECAAAFYNGEQLVPAFQGLYAEYGFENATPYENDTLKKYAADFDESYIVAGDSTIALLAGKAETEESYGLLSLLLIDRNYFEK